MVLLRRQFDLNLERCLWLQRGVDWCEAREDVVNCLRKHCSQVDQAHCAVRKGTCLREWNSAVGISWQKVEIVLYLGAEGLSMNPNFVISWLSGLIQIMHYFSVSDLKVQLFASGFYQE